MLGLTIGDALGGPVEFMSARQIALKHGLITEMIGGGWLHLRPGQTTDDTAMAMCLLQSLAQCGHYNRADTASRYIAWMNSGPLDIGNTIAGVLTYIVKGIDPDDAAERYHRFNDG